MLKEIACLFLGHKMVSPYESDAIIASKGCERCGRAWFPAHFKIDVPPPPRPGDNRTYEEPKKEYSIFLEREYCRIRKQYQK